MVKYFESNTIYPYRWSQVIQGYWNRYPNPYSTHVLSEDTLYREVQDGKLYSKRMLYKTQGVPKWGEKFIGKKNFARIIEESVVDPKEKVFITYTKNIDFTRFMSVVEKVVYQVSEDNPEWTIAKRSAWIDSNVFGFSRPIQAFGLDRFKKTCTKMSTGFNYVLAHMFPSTAQLMQANVSQIVEQQSQKTKLTNAAEGLQHSFQEKAGKMKDAAKKATDLAKKKTEPMYAAYQQSNQS